MPDKERARYFDLESALLKWAKAMTKSRKVDSRQREEMLDHLRLSVQSRIEAGSTPESAFSAAVADFGQSDEISREYVDRARLLAVGRVVGALIWAGAILGFAAAGYEVMTWLILGYGATVFVPLELYQIRLNRRLDVGTSSLRWRGHG